MCRNQWIFLIPPCLPAIHFGNFVYFQHIQKHIATFKRAHANRSRAISCMYMLCRRVCEGCFVCACMYCMCILYPQCVLKANPGFALNKIYACGFRNAQAFTSSRWLGSSSLLGPTLHWTTVFWKSNFCFTLKRGPGGAWHHLQVPARRVNSLVLVCSLSSHRHSYIHLIFSSRFIDS
jgi:hypothetical protein